MTAPTERPGGLDANARGIAVLVAAVLIGLLLLWKAGDGGTATNQVATDKVTSTTVDTSGLTDNSTTTTANLPTDTTQPAKTPGEVTVVVLNGGGVVGAAGSVSDTIGAAGYQMGAPKNATDSPNVDATIVYYAEGFQAEAGAVATVIGKDTSVVQALPADNSPGPGADTANVTVVLGKDAPPAGDAPATSDTTTTAPG